MNEFDVLTTAKLRDAYAALPKVPRADCYLMNWSTWCKARRFLKARRIPVTYRRVSKGKWRRYVQGVEVLLSRFVETDDIYELTNSLPRFMLGEPLGIPKTDVRRIRFYDDGVEREAQS